MQSAMKRSAQFWNSAYDEPMDAPDAGGKHSHYRQHYKNPEHFKHF